MFGSFVLIGLGVVIGWVIFEKPQWAKNAKTWVVDKVKGVWQRARD